jgi:leader peptidase (prepilin peptidase)/N-methyltransferase
MAAACTALFAWAWAVTPAGLVLAVSMALAWCLLSLAVTDALVFRLPDLLTLPLCAAGLLAAWRLPAADGLVDHVVGALAGYGVLALIAWGFRRLRGQDGIGMGDAKLMAAAGAWLGWRALPSVLLLGCLGGLLWWAVGRLADRRAERDPRIPFGAPLCAAVWLVWLYGPLEIGS